MRYPLVPGDFDRATGVGAQVLAVLQGEVVWSVLSAAAVMAPEMVVEYNSSRQSRYSSC